MSSRQKRSSEDASTTAIAAAKESCELSGYDKVRALNIERNNARLRVLGLISAAEERRSNDAAWGRVICSGRGAAFVDNRDDGDGVDEEWGDPRRPSGAKKRKKGERGAPRQMEGSRKSLRLKGIRVDGTELPSKESREERAERLRTEREEMIQECREVRLRAARAVAEAGAEKAARENPTATYEHCLMRVRTMNERGLANRVKVIERASGRHCVVKMAIFKSCLQDEGRWELAELASEALERLKGLQAPVE